LFPKQIREVRRRFHSTISPPLSSKNCGRRSSVQAIGKGIEPQKLDAYFSCFEELFQAISKNNTLQLLLPYSLLGFF
jgi:hypothetical protein